MKLASFSLLLAAALAPTAAAARAPLQPCSRLLRTYAHKADLPAGARAVLFPMAERGGRFNVSDAISYEDRDLPFARFISARQSGCVLNIRYEYGGIGHGFATASLELRGGVWRLVRRR